MSEVDKLNHNERVFLAGCIKTIIMADGDITGIELKDIDNLYKEDNFTDFRECLEEFESIVDTKEDLELVRKIYAHFDGRDDFSWLEVIELFELHPELTLINTGVNHKSVHDIDKRLPS